VKGARIAIFGLARSGLSVAKAAKTLGAMSIVVDEKPEHALKSKEILQEALALGAEVSLGWSGNFSTGFDFVVTSPGVPFDHPKLQSAVAAGVPVYSEVEFAYMISKAPIVAITGTNGKSTTTAMTYVALRAAGRDAMLCGNIYGSGFEEVPLTDAAVKSTQDQILVAEISSFQLEWVRSFKPIAAAITNITPDHLDRHRSFQEYAEAKQRIFAAQTVDDYAVINSDDPQIGRPSRPVVLTFGHRGDHARIADEAIDFSGGRLAQEDLQVYGEHNLFNAAAAGLLAAAAMTERRGTELSVPSAVLDGLKGFRGIAHRMEVLGEKDGVRVINNSMCTNPAAVVSSSMAIPALQHLLLGGSNKRLDFGPLQTYLSKSQNRAYLFGRDAEDLNKQLGGGHPVFETMSEAFQDAVRNANAGEVVMLAPGCASMDQFRDFEDRGNVFKSIAKEWLES
jgi:UDP-N-acetylmuramoylalanine--D-glutamate ligase